MKILHILIYSHIFPNPVEPQLGSFVHYPLAYLSDRVEIRVMAPVPYMLSWRRNKSGVRIPREELIGIGRHQLVIYRPRFPLFPRNLMQNYIGRLLYLFTRVILRGVHKTWKIDLIHSHFAQPNAIAVRLLAYDLGIPYIITEHKGAIEEYFKSLILKAELGKAYADAKAVVCVSDFLATTLKQTYPTLDNISILPNCLHSVSYPLKPQTTIPNRLVFVGNLVPDKGLQFLLPALKRLRMKGLELSLNIIGDGSYRGKLEFLSRELGIQTEVQFLGARDNAEIPALLHNADILVLPSRIESFGIVLIEAMACGLPVIATKCGGPQSIVTQNTGLLVNPSSVDALEQGISELISNWNSYVPETIRQEFIARFSIERYIDRITEIYHETAITNATHNSRAVCQFSSVHSRRDVRVFYKQCLSLVALGYVVHLVLADGLGSGTVQGVHIHDLGRVNNRLRRMILNPIKIMRIIYFLNCDVYHFHDPELMPVALILKCLKKVKIICDIHESYPEDFLQKEYLPRKLRPLLSNMIDRFEIWSVKHFDAVITATDHIAERFKNSSAKHLTLHNYPRLSEFDLSSAINVPNIHSQSTGRSFCYVGNITYQRGLAHIIKAIENIDCVFHLAGNYEPQSFRSELTKLPAWQKVIEHGFVDRKKTRELISQSCFGIILLLPLPNHIDALPTKAFEYMACGRAVLVPDFPIWQGIVAQNECGLCVNPLDTGEIGRAIDNLLSNPDQAREMGERGRKLVIQKYNWEAEFPDFAKFYQEILLS
ncbi:MAG: glycosyltransferase [Candidatus Cloacimonetes bacterium]|nr:glycosyltransferase [Candidatus Cloacimonadota bacterium]